MKLETALRLIIKNLLYTVIHDSISNLGKRKNNFFSLLFWLTKTYLILKCIYNYKFLSFICEMLIIITSVIHLISNCCCYIYVNIFCSFLFSFFEHHLICAFTKQYKVQDIIMPNLCLFSISSSEFYQKKKSFKFIIYNN